MAEVLIVDDEPDVRGLLGFALEDAGFDVRQAGDGEAAIAEVERGRPDCIVLDVMMPNVDGFGVLRQLRQRQLAPDTRVLMLTCKGDDRDHLRAFELGAHDYVTKPFNPEHLIERIQHLLDEDGMTLDHKRRQELQRAMLLDRLQTAFARGARIGGNQTPAHPGPQPEPRGETTPARTAAPLAWRLGGS